MYLIGFIVLICLAIIAAGMENEISLLFSITGFIIALIGMLVTASEPTKY